MEIQVLNSTRGPFFFFLKKRVNLYEVALLAIQFVFWFASA